MVYYVMWARWNVVHVTAKRENGDASISRAAYPPRAPAGRVFHPSHLAFTRCTGAAYLLRPYLSGRDAHFVMMSDLYRVDDLIIIGSDVPHQFLVLPVIPQEPFHFPCGKKKYIYNK